MLAYTIQCKRISDYLRVLQIMADSNMSYDVDLEKSLIHINEIEAYVKGFKDFCYDKKLLVPRRIMLKATPIVYDDPETQKFHYGDLGSAITTSGWKLVDRSGNSASVFVYSGFSVYLSEKRIRFWASRIGSWSIDNFYQITKRSNFDINRFKMIKATLESLISGFADLIPSNS